MFEEQEWEGVIPEEWIAFIEDFPLFCKRRPCSDDVDGVALLLDHLIVTTPFRLACGACEGYFRSPMKLCR